MTDTNLNAISNKSPSTNLNEPNNNAQNSQNLNPQSGQQNRNNQNLTNQNTPQLNQQNSPISNVKFDSNQNVYNDKEISSTIANDLVMLESIDWYKEMIVKLRRGYHPNPEIDQLLNRCFENIPKDKFLVHLPIRYLLTFAWVFVMCTLAWIIIWIFCKIFELNEIIWLTSGLMTTIFAALIGLSLSHPIVFIDEKALHELGTREIQKLKATLRLINAVKNNNNNQNNESK